MKKSILILALIGMTAVVFAQSSTPSKEILDKAYTAYTASKGVGFDFSFQTVDTSGKALPPQKGSAMAKGNSFRLSMPEMITWFNGKTQWVLLKSTNEVNISNPTPSEIASVSPMALLSMYQSGYQLKQPTTQTIAGKRAWVIAMTPTTKSDFRQITVAIDTRTYQILQVKSVLQNGMRSEVNIGAYNAKNNFPDAIFSFSKSNYPEVEIIDLR